MKLFLDTSALVKLYFKEEGTEELDKFLTDYPVKAIYLSEITKVEFNSAIWKKVRTKDLAKKDAEILQHGFRNDYSQYRFIPITENIIDRASDLIVKYGSMGLRTLDAIQLSCALEEKEQISQAKSADQTMEKIFSIEGIKC